MNFQIRFLKLIIKSKFVNKLVKLINIIANLKINFISKQIISKHSIKKAKFKIQYNISLNLQLNKKNK